MPILNLIIGLAVIGFLLWLLTTYVPMDPTIKRLIVAFVVIVTAIWLLQAIGVMPDLGNVRIR